MAETVEQRLAAYLRRVQEQRRLAFESGQKRAFCYRHFPWWRRIVDWADRYQ